MTYYKIIIEDRNYLQWKIYNSNNCEKKEILVNPVENKLFSNQLF